MYIISWCQCAGNALFAWRGIPCACWTCRYKERRSLTWSLDTRGCDHLKGDRCGGGRGRSHRLHGPEHADPEQGGSNFTPSSLRMRFGVWTGLHHTLAPDQLPQLHGFWVPQSIDILRSIWKPLHFHLLNIVWSIIDSSLCWGHWRLHRIHN